MFFWNELTCFSFKDFWDAITHTSGTIVCGARNVIAANFAGFVEVWESISLAKRVLGLSW